MKRALITLLVPAILLMPVFPAHADEFVCPSPSTDIDKNKEEARRYFSMGNTYFNMERYEKSAESFQCVIRLVPYSVMARFRLARSFDHLGKYSLAREHYLWVQADMSDESSPLKPEVEKRLKEIKNLQDKETPGTGVTGKKETPTEKPVKPEGEKDLPGIKRPVQDPPGGAVVPSDGLTSRWWFWTGVGVTAVFAGATVYTGLTAMDYRDKWESDFEKTDRDNLNRYKRLADVSFVGTVVSAAALGAAIFLLPHRTDPGVRGRVVGEKQMVLMPVCGPEGCMMTFSVGF